jgi:hypothetical protein
VMTVLRKLSPSPNKFLLLTVLDVATLKISHLVNHLGVNLISLYGYFKKSNFIYRSRKRLSLTLNKLLMLLFQFLQLNDEFYVIELVI